MLSTEDLLEQYLHDKNFLVFRGHLSNLAPFPGCPHLQSLITCSMQVRRGKALEICSCAVMLGGQRVDIQGAIPHKKSWSPLCSVNLRSWRPEHSQCSISTICCSQCQGHLAVKQELHDCTEKICCKDCLPHQHSSVWNENGIGYQTIFPCVAKYGLGMRLLPGVHLPHKLHPLAPGQSVVIIWTVEGLLFSHCTMSWSCEFGTASEGSTLQGLVCL